MTLVIALLAGCGGCGGEKAKPKDDKSTAANRTETEFTGIADAVETNYVPPAAAPTPVPIPQLKVDHPQIFELTPQSAGSASVGLLDNEMMGAAGLMGAGSIGDYVLANARSKYIFKAIKKRKAGEPLVVYLTFTNKRHEGALVDVVLQETPVDFLDEFTQALGTEASAPVIDYDSVQFVRRDALPTGEAEAVGIKFTGSLAKSESEEIRIETTYWLSSDSTRLDIHSQVISGDAQAQITDFTNFGPANVLADIYGVPPRGGAVLDIEWCAAQLGDMALGFGVAAGRLEAHFQGGSLARLLPYVQDGETRNHSASRSLFSAAGNFSAVTDQIFTQLNPGRPVGIFKGTVVDKDYLQPAPGTWADVYYYERADPQAVQNRRTFTRAAVDDNGNFQCTLPILDAQAGESRFFIGTGARSRQFGLSERGIVLHPGETVERQMQVGRPAILNVRVVDSQTSESLAARIRFEAIPPTLPANFDNIESANGYADSFYVPRDGAKIEMNQGFYTLTASHGIIYNITKVDVETAWGFETEAVIALDKVNPTPGWVHLELGVLTRATPGCTLSARDAVLACAGEGLQWLVSGDMETITDLQPAVEELGMTDKIKTSRGFRTYLPKRPEWGNFIIYKLPADAPDPKLVRDQWRDMTDSEAFMATLRRLYPGSLIHVCFPWSYAIGVISGGSGYFYQDRWNVYQMAFDDAKRNEKLEMNVDSASMFPRRGGWQVAWERDFFYINTLRSRFIAPIPSNETRLPFLSEPGYPRTLLRTDTSGLHEVNEEAVFGALKSGRWQVTSGPFIEFKSDGRGEGDLYAPTDNKAYARFGIRAPDWAPTTHVSLTLDGIMLWKESDNSGAGVQPDRFRFNGEVKLSPQFKENADTTIGAETLSEGPLADMLTRRPEARIPSFAVIGPIFADTNSNGLWDPPKYLHKGK